VSTRIVRRVGGVLSLAEWPDSVVYRGGRIWNVFARSLGEQGADGRTALAWRWAHNGGCPSPVTLNLPLGRAPDRTELLAEAGAQAETAAVGDDPGGQVMHARFVLRWLAGDLDALPLWNGGPASPQVTDGAPCPRSPAEIEQAYDWALLARLQYPSPDGSSPASAYRGFGWAFGAMQALSWVCGERAEGPLTGLRVPGRRPTLYEVALDTRRAMTSLIHLRRDGDLIAAGRVEAIMATFLWLAGWDPASPADRRGHGSFEEFPEGTAQGPGHRVTTGTAHRRPLPG